MPRYNYTLIIRDDETDEDVGLIEALTTETLEEKMRYIPDMIKSYEEKKQELDDLSDCCGWTITKEGFCSNPECLEHA